MVLPDDVAEETSYVVARRFAGHPERDAAEALLRGLLSIAERAPAEAGTPHLAEAERLIRDRSDAPVLAAALASRPDVLVTGDKDFHAIADKLPFEVLTTREALKRLGLG